MHPSELVLVPPGDVERWGALTGAAVLLAYGARQRSLFGLCAATMAIPLAWSVVTFI